jgi:hypothetical protein
MTWKSWNMTRNSKIVPNWNTLGKSSLSLQIMEDDQEMMADDLAIVEDNQEMMEDEQKCISLRIVEDYLEMMEDDLAMMEDELKMHRKH